MGVEAETAVQESPKALDAIISSVGKVGTSAETAYQVLRGAIIAGALPPGSRIRADDLAIRLGVSKTPVREAIRRLEAEELIAVEPRSGLIVKSVSEEQILEIYYIREALEGMAARLAAENIGRIGLTNLRYLLSDMEEVHRRGDLAALRRIAGEFQLLVFQAARNERLYRILDDLQGQVRRYPGSTLTLPGRAEEALSFYRHLLQAISNRDPDCAEDLARANRRRTLELRIRMGRAGKE